MSEPKLKTYLFVRQDISIAQQMVQACHAAQNSPPYNGKLIIFGVKNLHTLVKSLDFTISKNIQVYPFHEPPMNNELTAFITEPLNDERANVFSRYRLWNPVDRSEG